MLPTEAKLGVVFFAHENLHGDSFIEPKAIESWLACAIFDTLHARIERKFIEKMIVC